jgi:ribosome recycling factor
MRITFAQSDAKFKESLEYFKNQLGALRVGRGSLQMIESVRAEVYGQAMPLNQIAGVNMVDASLITVTPWDKNNIQAIVKAVQSSNLGINPAVDGDTVRLPIPPLTEERRKEYIKLLNTKTEDAKVAVRQIRKDLMETIEEDKKQGAIGEDEMNRLEKEVQKKVDQANQEIEKTSKDKERDLLQV